MTAEYVENLDKQGLLKRNFNRPPIKDTISLSTGITLYLPAISLSLAKTPKDELDSTGTIPSGTSLATLTTEKALKIFKSRAKKLHDKEARKKVIAHEKEVILNKLKMN